MGENSKAGQKTYICKEQEGYSWGSMWIKITECESAMNRSCCGPVEYDRVFVFYFQHNENQFALKF